MKCVSILLYVRGNTCVKCVKCSSVCSAMLIFRLFYATKNRFEYASIWKNGNKILSYNLVLNASGTRLIWRCKDER